MSTPIGFKSIGRTALRTAAFVSMAIPLSGSAQAPSAIPVKNVVLVHGAWADGSSWAKIIPLLEAKGLHVVAVQNPLTSLAGRCSSHQADH